MQYFDVDEIIINDLSTFYPLWKPLHGNIKNMSEGPKIKDEEIGRSHIVERVEKMEGKQNKELQKIRYWMGDTESIKLMKLSEQMMSRVLENWSKFRLTIHKLINEEESKIIDSMAMLRKQIHWLNTIHLGEVPELSKCTSKLYKELQTIIEEIEKSKNLPLEQKPYLTEFNIKKLYRQSKLITDKLLDTAKVTFNEIKEKVKKMMAETRDLSSLEELLKEKTYFRFLNEQKHSLVKVIDDESIVVESQGYDMDFGAVAGPAFTENNSRIAFLIETNDKYQFFIGLGACHPKIVKNQIYKGSGINSGAYLIRQQCESTQSIALSHAFEQEGTHKKQKKIKWGFGENDIVYVEMDFRRKKLCFWKMNHEECTHEMSVDLSQGPVAPYVILHSKWDRVGIVNY